MEENGKIIRPKRKIHLRRVLFVLIAVLAALFVIFKVTISAKVNKRIEAIKKAGFPVTCEQLEAWYVFPKGDDNAADILLRAFSEYYQWKDEYLKDLPAFGRVFLPARTESLSAETKKLVTEFLSDNQKTVELLMKGATKKDCRYPINLSAGFRTAMPYSEDIRDCRRTLKLVAVLAAENNQPNNAFRAIQSMFGLSNTFANEPVYESQYVRCSCLDDGIFALERVLNKVELSDELLLNVGKQLADVNIAGGVIRAFAGDRCNAIDLFQKSAGKTADFYNSFGASNVVSPITVALYKLSGISDKDMLLYLDIVDDAIKTARLPQAEQQKAANKLGLKVEAVSKNRTMLSMIMHDFYRLILRSLTATTRCHIASAALAVERFRLAKGTLPESLDEIVPQYLASVPVDPFNEKPVKYKKLPKGFIIYSVGENGIDDGGKEESKDTGRNDKDSVCDVTFIIERGAQKQNAENSPVSSELNW
jgi:hypothetical protein